MMTTSDETLRWIDEQIRERKAISIAKERNSFDPTVPAIDAGTFDQKITDLAQTMRHKIHREGPAISIAGRPFAVANIPNWRVLSAASGAS